MESEADALRKVAVYRLARVKDAEQSKEEESHITSEGLRAFELHYAMCFVVGGAGLFDDVIE